MASFFTDKAMGGLQINYQYQISGECVFLQQYVILWKNTSIKMLKILKKYTKHQTATIPSREPSYRIHSESLTSDFPLCLLVEQQCRIPLAWYTDNRHCFCFIIVDLQSKDNDLNVNIIFFLTTALLFFITWLYFHKKKILKIWKVFSKIRFIIPISAAEHMMW